MTVKGGERFPARFGREGFRRNFRFEDEWRGRRFATKQLEAYAVEEGGDWLVITVIVRYFRNRRHAAMKLSYDSRHNIAYLRLREKTAQVETIRVSDEINIDIAPDGTVYGIEFLNANAQLREGDNGCFVVVDEAAGDRREIPLAR